MGKLFDIALKLEGLTRHASKHAAGIVISPEPIDEGKWYINLSNMDDKTWFYFISKWCNNTKRTESGYHILKYDDWKLGIESFINQKDIKLNPSLSNEISKISLEHNINNYEAAILYHSQFIK